MACPSFEAGLVIDTDKASKCELPPQMFWWEQTVLVMSAVLQLK